MTKKKSREAIVMVHPFDSPKYETQQDYLEERDALLRGGEKDLYVLTNKVEETRERLGCREAGVISTEEANPKPRMGWKHLSRILRDYEEVVFCGAELHFKENGKPCNGEVLDVFQKIKHSNKYIYFACCWIGD